MAFSPTSFPASSPLLATTMLENDDKLRKYLHEGIVSGDLQSGSAWVDTKHVQPPRIDPVRNVQHGATGHLGGRVYKPGEWFTMTGAYFSANVYAAGAMEVRNNVGDGSTNRSGFSANRGGPAGSYNCSGYGQRTGAYFVDLTASSTSTNEVHFGLAHWSLSHVGLVTSWAVCVEAYY